MTTTFNDLGLAPEVLKAIAAMGYSTPTPVQIKAIPELLAGRDVLAAAQTGTGKTAAFALPIITRMLADPQKRAPRRVRALILAPTRELAAQIDENIRGYAKETSLKTALVFGGVNIKPQTEELAHGADFLVATPGRLLDHVGQQNVDLSAVEYFVLDEADRMLDMGFIHDIKKIVRLLPDERQTLMFSATFNDEIRALAQSFLNSPATVEIARNKENALIHQEVFLIAKKRKRELLRDLIAQHDWDQVLVFTRMKHAANRLAEQLNKDGIVAAAIHGNKSQSARTKALAGFKAHQIRVLVATDIAARGLDIEGLPHVVNYELPNVPQDYVHRIGRTGRAGVEGHAVSLVSPDESAYLKDIEKLLKKKLPATKAAGYEGDMPEDLALEEAKADRARAEELERMRASRRKASAARETVRRSTDRAAREEERASGLSVNPEERFEKKIARPAVSAAGQKKPQTARNAAAPQRKPAAASVERALQASDSAKNGARRTQKSTRTGAEDNERRAARPQTPQRDAVQGRGASSETRSRNARGLGAQNASRGSRRSEGDRGDRSERNERGARRNGGVVVHDDRREQRLFEERRRRASNIKSTVRREHSPYEDRALESRGYRVESVRSTLPPEMQRKLRGR